MRKAQKVQKAQIVQAPNDYPRNIPAVFLAGSIEMGVAEPWQDDVAKYLQSRYSHDQLVILNPRRDDWDASWKQDIEHDEFRRQVVWELSGLEHAAVVPVYFASGTKSPITLFEFGFVAAQRKDVIVYAPDDFYRRGNIQIVCHRYAIPSYFDGTCWLRQVREACDDAVFRRAWRH